MEVRVREKVAPGQTLEDLGSLPSKKLEIANSMKNSYP
jgi:hypothetical protein